MLYAYIISRKTVVISLTVSVHSFHLEKTLMSAANSVTCRRQERAYVDVIIPVHNAAETIVDTIKSVMIQRVPQHLISVCPNVLDVAVCCFDDGSTDESFALLQQLKNEYMNHRNGKERIQSKLLISTSKDGIARGAGYARNQATSLRDEHVDDPYFLCLLDSDDIMFETRVAEQVSAMMALNPNERERTIMGCNFDRDPPLSTWHYAKWANGLTDERLTLERFREVTVLQPTWIMTKSRFHTLGGYVEAPHPKQIGDDWSIKTDGTFSSTNKDGIIRIIHESYDTPQSLRLAEDLRLFHSHLLADGLLRLHRTEQPLVTYRHRAGASQSSQTPRKLLLHLRVLAFEQAVLRSDPLWAGPFVVWGAGRDGKDFVKALSKDIRKRVACFVDVDERKIEAGYYDYKDMDIRIPIVHFSWLSTSQEETDGEVLFGRIDKTRNGEQVRSKVEGDSRKKRKDTADEKSSASFKKKSKTKVPKGLDLALLPTLPFVVCVSMYRTNGALEANVKSVGRTEGKDMWHFS